MLSKLLIATTAAVGIMTDAMAQSSDPHTAYRMWQGRNPVSQEHPPGYRSSISEYDGPIYNIFGQVIGSYRGPILGYSSSCNILTPTGSVYICENFTW
jgi:hypothetical protein